MPKREKVRRPILLAAFFITGATALVFEVVWARLLLLSLGTTPAAVGVVLGAFMGGMAIGSYVAGWRVFTRHDPIVIYAVLEGWVGAYGLASPALLRAVDVAPPELQFGVALLLLLPATVAMGASLPLLSRALGQGTAQPAVVVGHLYAATTAGGFLGPIAAVFYLFPAFGLHATLVIAAGVNLVVFAGLLASRRVLPDFVPIESREWHPREGRVDTIVLAALATSGAVAMIYEVAWGRMLAMVYGSSVYGVSIMLSTFLFGLAGGSALAAFLLRRRPASRLALAWLLIGSAGTGFASLLVAQRLPFVFVDLYRLYGSVEGRDPALFLIQFVAAALLMLPSTLCLGAMLPVATSVAPADANLGRQVSRLYAGNLIGSALGALVASGLLLAALGIEFSVRAASLVALATSVLVVLKSPKLHVVTTAMAVFGAVSILALDPSGGRLVTSFGLYSSAPSYLEDDANGLRELVASHNLLYYRDGPAATVAVQQVDRYRLLKINGKTDASNRGADVETQMLLGHLPLMAADARHVAVIGWGSGMTAGAVLSHPVESVEFVDAFEIEPAVVEASRYFEPSNGQPLNDPRLRLISGDARSLLGRADVVYDLIISHPSNSWITGVANLFTQDFFELATSRLASEGIFCQWVPLYGMSEESTRSLVATFRSVFPHTIAFRNRDLILLGSDRPIRFSFQRLLERFQDPRVKQSLEQAFVRYPTDLLVKLRLDEAGVETFSRGVPLNTDDNMRLELAAPRTLYQARIEATRAEMARYPPDVLEYLVDYESEPEMEFELAASFFTAGMDEQALRHCRRALELETSFDGLKLLGQVLHRQGELRAARTAWERALAWGGDPASRAFVETLLRSLTRPAGR